MAYVMHSLLSAFSGLLRGLMIKPKPIYWIASWDDLAELQHLTLWVTSVSDGYYYANNSINDSLAENFAKRMVVTDHDYLENEPKRWDTDVDYDGVRDGKVALVCDLFYLNTLKQNLISRYEMIEDLDFNKSKSADLVSQPTFIVTNVLSFDDHMASKLNLVYYFIMLIIL